MRTRNPVQPKTQESGERRRRAPGGPNNERRSIGPSAIRQGPSCIDEGICARSGVPVRMGAERAQCAGGAVLRALQMACEIMMPKRHHHQHQGEQ